MQNNKKQNKTKCHKQGLPGYNYNDSIDTFCVIPARHIANPLQKTKALQHGHVGNYTSFDEVCF